MFRTEYSDVYSKLWENQKQAIDRCQEYLENPNSGSALIRMPTGTGKSGIISILSKCFSKYRNVIVITPSKALNSQLTKDIKSRFWKRAKINNKLIPKKKVHNITPSELLKLTTDNNIFEDEIGLVLVCTYYTIQQLHREIDDDNSKFSTHYQILKNKIDLVLVDEGHREPAPRWAEAVRQLELPTILFTATPYRNDQQLFNVNSEFVYKFSHTTALENHFIRNVEFEIQDFNNNRYNFVQSLLEYYNKNLINNVKNYTDTPKVIVRCETSDEITEIQSLISKSYPAIGIHENFSDGDDNELIKSVPDIELDKYKKYIFWIHQNKLIEGIDNTDFCLLAFYKPLRNARSIVQQIGRIIRNKKLIESGNFTNETAYVFSHKNYRLDEYWKAYIEYEKWISLNPERQEEFELKLLFKWALIAQPEYLYYQQNYRKRIFTFLNENSEDELPDQEFEIDETNSEELVNNLALLKQVNIFNDDHKFNIDELRTSIISEREVENKFVHRILTYPSKYNNFILIYQKHKTTPFLFTHYFIEFSIGYVICFMVDDLLFYFDSDNKTSDIILDNYTHISGSGIQGLLKGENARITQIGLRSLDLGDHSIRRKILYPTHSLKRTVSNFNDHMNFPSTITGQTQIDKQNYISRYIGISRGRVSDSDQIRIGIDEYEHWLEYLANEIKDQKQKVLPVLDRYAPRIIIDSIPNPTSLQFDDNEFTDQFKHVETNQSILFHDTFYEITKFLSIKGKPITGFKLELINSETKEIDKFEIRVEFDKKTKRFKLSNLQKLSDMYVKMSPITNQIEQNIVQYFNRNQPFRITFDNPDYLYAYGDFFKPKLKLFSSKFGDAPLELLEIFYPIQELQSINSEKGKSCSEDGSDWDTTSLFYFINHFDELTDSHEYANLDYLICSDMGTEPADFIGISEKENRVIFIHAKAKNPPTKRSATTFQDVGAQAIKNLYWFHPYAEEINPPINIWSKPWTANEITGQVESRLLIPRKHSNDFDAKLEAKKAWGLFRKIIRSPKSKKEVWIVLGSGFSLDEFEKERNKRNPRPEIAQIFFYLQTIWNQMDQSDVSDFRIYCSP